MNADEFALRCTTNKKKENIGPTEQTKRVLSLQTETHKSGGVVIPDGLCIPKGL